MCAIFPNDRAGCSRGAARKRGLAFTLAEIIIGSMLLLLLFGLFSSFLTTAMRSSVRGSIRAAIQQEAVTSLNRLCADLRLSAAGGISYYATGSPPEGGPVYLGIMRLADIDSQGRQEWEQALVVYSWQGQGAPLFRKEWTPAITLAASFSPALHIPAKASQATLEEIAGSTAITGQVLSRDVSEFKVTGAMSGGTVSSPLEPLITITRKGATGKSTPENFTLSTTISFKNEL
ncbi:MAG: hypothetical protein RDV48_24740 [Candidatus Eremiobacteraeota bacterium]|nr:hypothetical protein [Candidatus Eremiobacteraeota bacterium]